jgi:hypothetical protein
MKKLIFFISIGLTINLAQSQEIPDALRYSQDNLNGTARFRAMGGAFGALGGDLSSINVNPAGSSIFSNNQLAVTLTNFNKKNESDYFGTKTETTNNSFDLNQVGGVFVFKNKNQSSNWKKFAVAINYEMTNNFDNSVFSAGRNPNNSVANYFLSYANPNLSINQGGFYLGSVKNSYYEDFTYEDQQAYLGITGNVIKPNFLQDNNDSYSSNSIGGNYYQENIIESTGHNSKISFNASTVYNDKLMIGVNLNSHFTDYRQSTEFFERNDNNNVSGIKNATFRNDLYTYGSGFSFQLGTIYKATKELRLGITYESPTWYRLNDQLNQKLFTTGLNFINYNVDGVNNYPVINGQSSTSSDSDITNLYEPYKLETPGKWTGSLAYVFGKKGLISFDYARKDFGTTTFKPKQDFTGANNQMSNILTVSNEFRVGAEYKIKEWSLRGGYRFEESPYKNKRTIGDLNSYSGGLGYNFGIFKLDLAYSNTQRNAAEGFFTQGFTDGAKIKTTNNNFTMTLLFEM